MKQAIIVKNDVGRYLNVVTHNALVVKWHLCARN
jgi:hypothetical protein